MNTVLLYACTFVAVIAITPVHAQERAASGSLDQQATWASLSAQVKDAVAKTAAVDSRVNQIVTCNKNFKLYAPGVNGADSNGCIDNTPLLQLTNRVTKVEGDLTSIVNRVTRIETCGAGGKFTNGKVCIDGGGKGLDHYEILYPEGNMSCAQKVTKVNQYVGHSPTSDYIGIPYSSRLVGVNGDWILDGGDSDCSPMSNKGRWPMIIPKDADNKPIKGFYKVIH